MTTTGNDTVTVNRAELLKLRIEVESALKRLQQLEQRLNK